MVLFHKDNHVTLILSFTSFRLSLNFPIQATYLRLAAWIIVIQLLAGEDQTLLVWVDALFVLNLGLDNGNGVRTFHIQGDGLTGQGLHEELHLVNLSHF